MVATRSRSSLRSCVAGAADQLAKHEKEEAQAIKTTVKHTVKEELPDADSEEDEEFDDDKDEEFDDDKDEDYEVDEEEEEVKKKDVKVAAAAAAASPYESLRLQRIAENKARMAALGVQKHAASLTSFFQATKPGKRPWRKSPITPIQLRRRSERLKNNSPAPGFYSPYFSHSYGDDIDESPKLQLVLRNRVCRNYQDEDTMRPGNAPIPKNCPADLQISPAVSALRCKSKERGTLYDAIVGICCHFCRQKKLCGEEDCERCGQRDVTKACSGKTDCSRCHSSTGVFCRGCLKIRYGEEIEQVREKAVWLCPHCSEEQEIEQVREKADWLCPHCSEEQGLNPYWICNSSICLSRRKMAPTGIAIFKAREMGYDSVAHYLADLLQKQSVVGG